MKLDLEKFLNENGLKVGDKIHFKDNSNFDSLYEIVKEENEIAKEESYIYLQNKLGNLSITLLQEYDFEKVEPKKDNYQEALDKAIREFEIDLEDDCNNEWLKCEIKDLKETKKELEKLKEENAKYKALEQELGCPLENAMVLFQVCKNKKYYFKFDDKIYECDNAYVNNIYWNEATNEAFISVNTNNKELEKKGAYDVMLFAKDYNKTWWIAKPEEENNER